MGDVKWPAVAIQSIFLASNIAYLLAGRADGFIIASTSVIVFLFMVQASSDNPRFMYLFPVDLPRGTKIPSLDTWFLKGSILLSILFFYIGAIGSYVLPFLIVGAGLAFLFVWKQYIEPYNKRRIDRLLGDDS